jgi:AMP nucleosidase
MGSPNAAGNGLLSAIIPRLCLFLGKCGGLKKKNKLGDLILPIAAIRSAGTLLTTSRWKIRHFGIQAAKRRLCRNSAKQPRVGQYRLYNKQGVWEYDDRYKKYLVKTRAMQSIMRLLQYYCWFCQRNPFVPVTRL